MNIRGGRKFTLILPLPSGLTVSSSCVFTENVCDPACHDNAYCGTHGGTDCTCNAGYHGDGQTAGTGCTGTIVI